MDGEPTSPKVFSEELIISYALCVAALVDLPPGVDNVLARILADFQRLPPMPLAVTLATDGPIDALAPTTTLWVTGEVFPWFSHAPQGLVITTNTVAILGGYRLELFGAFYPSDFKERSSRAWELILPSPTGEPQSIVYTDDDGREQALYFRTWRQRAYLGASPLYAELRWPLELEGDIDRPAPHITLGGLEYRHTAEDMELLNAAILKLGRITRQLRGRPDDTGYFRGDEGDQYLEAVETAVSACIDAEEPVNRKSVARRMGSDRKTVGKYLIQYGFNLKVIETRIRANRDLLTHTYPSS